MLRNTTKNSVIKDDNVARRKTRSVSPIPPRNLANDNGAEAVAPIAKKTRTSLRNIKYCTDLNGIENSLKCDACSRWDNLVFKKKPREETKTREYQCLQVWRYENDAVPGRLLKHYNGLIRFVELNMHIDRRALLDEPMPSSSTTTTANNDDAGPVPTPSPPQRNITLHKDSFWSQGRFFEFELPTSHKICHISDIKRWKNGYETTERIKMKFQRKLYRTDCLFSQALWAFATSAAPGLALSAAQWLFPLIVLAFLYDTGIFADGLPADTFPKSFPSDATMRKYTINQAVRETISLGIRLLDKIIYLACDKGNKKGVSHFVKILAWWEGHRVVTQLLDIDASGGTSEECADAIEASMNKLKATSGAATHLLSGQGTDSGGGGVLEGLARALQAKPNLCVPPEFYLVAPCCIHALQLQLRNAVIAVFGDGGLDKINAMQLIHSVYDLQETLDQHEWRHILWKSNQFVATFDPIEDVADNIDALKGRDKYRAEFNKKYADAVTFSINFKKDQLADPSTLTQYKGTVYSKMTAPILTRWWTVGAGASFVFDYYLVIYHACQAIINTYESVTRANKIASCLFSLMSDRVNFIDMTLIRCFNKSYIHPHLDWLQACNDETDNLGFQAHNIAVRFYLMNDDLYHLLSRDKMNDYKNAIDGHDDDGTHLNKLNLFGRGAYSSLHTHFTRWLTTPLLPAALLSEPPTAKIVAAVMLGVDRPPMDNEQDVVNHERMTGSIKFNSKTHGTTICMVLLDRFLRRKVKELDNSAGYTQESKLAAQLVLDGLDLRRKDYSGPQGPLLQHMHTKYYSLPSQTQFVETGVKDAKNVSTTDRSEQTRTCMSILRSVTPLGKTEKDANANKIRAIVKSTAERIAPHIRDRHNDGYKERFTALEHTMTKAGHFQQARLDKKKTTFDAKSVTYKRQNVAQQPKPQQQTPALTGLIPLGKIFQTKDGHMDALVEELCHRGVPIADVQKMKITARKDKLKALEATRLVAEEGMTEAAAVERAKKYFKVLSSAAFQFSD